MNYCLFLARLAVETFVKTGEVIDSPADCPPALLSKKSGVFVTLKKNNRLRGCIGTYLPTMNNLAKEIIRSAVRAATADPRFPRLQTRELPSLHYTVSLLSSPQPVKTLEELNPKEYGIIVQDSSGKTGLLLPNVEEVETVLQQIAIACQKAGINPSAENISLWKFKTQQYSEENDKEKETLSKREGKGKEKN